MRKLALLFGFAAISAFAAQYSGTISDSDCGAKHRVSSAICIQSCLRAGTDAVLVTSDKKLLKIDPISKDKIMAFVGKKVTITGLVVNGALKVDSVKVRTGWIQSATDSAESDSQTATGMCPPCPPRR